MMVPKKSPPRITDVWLSIARRQKGLPAEEYTASEIQQAIHRRTADPPLDTVTQVRKAKPRAQDKAEGKFSDTATAAPVVKEKSQKSRHQGKEDITLDPIPRTSAAEAKHPKSESCPHEPDSSSAWNLNSLSGSAADAVDDARSVIVSMLSTIAKNPGLGRDTASYYEQLDTNLRIRATQYFGAVPVQHQNESNKEFKERCKQKGVYCLENAISFQKLGFAMPAVYFDVQGSHLTTDAGDDYKTQAYFALQLDNHMPMFRAFVVAEPVHMANAVKTHESTSEGSGTADTSAEDFDHHELPQILERVHDSKAESFCNSVHAMVHYTAFKAVDWTDFKLVAVEGHQVLKNELRSLPAPLKQYIVKEFKAGNHPVMIRLSFDAEHAAYLHLYKGLPDWALAWAGSIKTGRFVAVVRGDGLTVPRLSILRDYLCKFKVGESPLSQFYVAGVAQHIGPNKMITQPAFTTASYDYQPRTVFLDMNEYLTVMGISCLSKYNLDMAAIDKWKSQDLKLHIASNATTDSHEYTGWLEIPKGCNRFTEDTTLRLVFKSQWNVMETKTTIPEKWSAKVSPHRKSHAPSGMIPLTIQRPYCEARKIYSKQAVSLVEARRPWGTRLANILGRDEGNQVRIILTAPVSVKKAQLEAMEEFKYPPKDRPLTEWNEIMKNAMLGSRLDKLEPQDIYLDVREEFPDVTTLMKLNEAQHNAVIAMQAAPGGLVVIQGPPGTGKTHMAREITKPFLCSKKSHQILVVTAANTAVNALAEEYEMLMQRLRAEGLLGCEGYALRIFPQSIEDAVRDIELKLTKDQLKTRPINLGEVSTNQEREESTGFVSPHSISNAAARNKAKYASIQDKRARNPELSVTAKALEIAGISTVLNTKSFIWATVRGEWKKYCRGDKDTDADLNMVLKVLTDDTIRKAKVLVTTTDLAGLPHIMDLIENTVTLVIADEAARESEPSYFPLFAARFTKIRGFIMLGDHFQLPPQTFVHAPDDIFEKQMEISFMSRLFYNGFVSYEMTHQHRMNEELCNMANALTYGGTLTTDTSARIANRNLSCLMRSFIKGKTGTGSTMMMIDIKSGGSTVDITPEGSKFDNRIVEETIMIASELLKLHETAIVGMLTGYKEQKARLNTAIRRLKNSQPSLFKNNPNRLEAETVNSAQGQQYDFTIYSILCDKKGLGFQTNSARGNVATTRAKNGFVLICDAQMVHQASEEDPNFSGRLVHYLMNFKLTKNL